MLRVLVRYVVHGKANHKQTDVKTIVIYQGGKLGDMICTTPMFRAIKAHDSNVRVVVLGSAGNRTTLEHNPDVDEYVVFNEHDDFGAVIRRLQELKPEYACMTAPSALAVSVFYLSGIPLIGAPFVRNNWSPFMTITYRILCDLVVKVDHYMGHYVPREHLRLLTLIGIHAHDTKKYVYASMEAGAKMERFVNVIPKGYRLLVGIMPGAGNKIKQWPPERFAEISNYLITKHSAHVCVIGNHTNSIEIDAMIKGIDKKSHVTDCRGMTLDELKAFIPHMDLTVSVDTGPIFIAEANNIPTIDIGGVISPHEMAPNDGKRHILITSDGPPQLWSLNSRVYDYKKVREGIESITTDDVCKVTDQLIDRLFDT